MTDTELTIFRRAAYEAACLAENAWQDELERVYGRDANAARYDSKRNNATPMLAALREIKVKTSDAWMVLGRIARNEIAA